MLWGVAPAEAGLADELGRSETRVYAAPFRPAVGRTVDEQRLVPRLERLDYARVHRRPTRPGTYFLGEHVLWVFRRAHRHAGRDREALLFALDLARPGGTRGRVTGFRGAEGPLDPDDGAWLEPELLAESLEETRAPRVPVRLAELPPHVWRAVLAAEDHRFFEHAGVDGRAIARAALANLRAGRTVQGASTITQQLVKNRDLGPQRTLGRKLSEAARALTVEAGHEKTEILEAYLDLVYFGRVGGSGVYGLGAAADAYFSKPARALDLGEAALLAAIIRSPNRLSPLRHPEEARGRRDVVLRQMAELGWAGQREVTAAIARPVRTRADEPGPPPARAFRGYVASEVRAEEGARLARGRGVVAETTLDLELQRAAESLAAGHLRRLRDEHRALRGSALSVAVIVLDGASGDVLAYVGGDPRDADDHFDRARAARRQPGSAVKPFVLLEAFDDCGGRDPLHPATRVADEPLTVTLPAGTWRPVNPDGRWHGVETLREALRRSDNVPFVRVARHCGIDAVAARMERAGLALPDDPPLSAALGSVEVTPLALARAYTVFAGFGDDGGGLFRGGGGGGLFRGGGGGGLFRGGGGGGEIVEPRPVTRIERPSGGTLERDRPSSRRVARAASAWLVRDLLRDAVDNGTGRAARIDGVTVAGKTGTTTEARDAWFAGTAGDLVAVVWVGVDRGGALGLGGAAAAAPLWREVMERAVAMRAPAPAAPPSGLVARKVDPESGLVVSGYFESDAYEEVFRRAAQPPRARFWRPDDPAPVLR